MKKGRYIFLFLCLLLIAATTFIYAKSRQTTADSRFVYYVVDPKKQEIKLYYKDSKGNNFGSIKKLVEWGIKHKQPLLFATNGGMYKPDHSPLGLFIQNKKNISKLNTANGGGNFYLKPNGIFYITVANIASICLTEDFVNKDNIKYATQSGPMLIINGRIHPAFQQGSVNLNIRSGVGILPNNKVLFAMSKTPVSFYDIAAYFKAMGCKNALYLDGFVSRTYLPEKKWVQTDGDFGVIIGVTQK